MYKWEKIVQEFTSTWEIKPVISLLYKPNVYFESILYIYTLVSLEEIILLSEKPDSVERNVLIQCHLSKGYFYCKYCDIVCRGNEVTDYRNHKCRFSKIRCVEVNNIVWNNITVFDHIAEFNKNYFSFPGKPVKTINDSSFEDRIEEIFTHNNKYFKLPAGTARRMELGHLKKGSNRS
jgi:hypothetical protein